MFLSFFFFLFFFFFNDTATTEIYTLSLHDALPIFRFGLDGVAARYTFQIQLLESARHRRVVDQTQDRKSTRLNSSHPSISYAVFCLKKKKKKSKSITTTTTTQ